MPVESAEKPKGAFVYVTLYTGHFDILHPDNIENQYSFHNLPKELHAHYVVKEDLDTGDALYVAQELQQIYSHYLYTSSKDDIAKVVDWLEAHDDEQYRLKLEYEIAAAQYQIAEATKKLESAQRELANIDAVKEAK